MAPWRDEVIDRWAASPASQILSPTLALDLATQYPFTSLIHKTCPASSLPSCQSLQPFLTLSPMGGFVPVLLECFFLQFRVSLPPIFSSGFNFLAHCLLCYIFFRDLAKLSQHSCLSPCFTQITQMPLLLSAVWLFQLPPLTFLPQFHIFYTLLFKPLTFSFLLFSNVTVLQSIAYFASVL